MLQYNPTVTGSLQVSGDITGTINGINITGLSQSVSTQLVTVQSSTASSDAKFETLSGVTSSALTRLTNIESKSASVDISISNINSITASNIARLSNLETKSSSVDISLSSINSKTGSYATTGSNSFYGTQVFSGSVYIANDLVVQGSSSIQYISASSVSLGTNIIQLNTANPSVRFAGLTMIDSGSVGGSGSFLYDSLQDEFIFVHRGNGANITSSHFVLGPETYDGLGNETYLTCNTLSKGTGKEHLIDSCITDNGTTICFNTPTGSFSGRLGIGITNPTTALHVSGTIAAGEASTGWGRLSFDGSTNNVRLQASKNGTDSIGLSFWTQASGGGFAERMIISGTNVGIGTTSPSYALEVCSNVADWASRIYNSNGAGNGLLVRTNNTCTNTTAFGVYNGTQYTMAVLGSGVTNFACQICSPQFTGGFVCAVGGLNVRGASTTWSTFNLFPDNPGGAGAQCNTVLAGSIVGCTGWGPQLRFSGPAAGFIDIGQDCNGAFVVETSDTPRLRVHQCGAVQISCVAYKSYILSDATIQTPVPILQLDTNTMYEIEYVANHYSQGIGTTGGWWYVKWHGYDGSGDGGQGGGYNFTMQVIQCSGTGEGSCVPRIFGCIQTGKAYICYGNGYMTNRQLNIRRLIDDSANNRAFL
jgi:hypothetical protein